MLSGSACTACVSGLKLFNSISAVIVLRFPKKLANSLVICRRAVLLETTVDLPIWSLFASHQLMTAFMWHGLMAKRGANDVVSCLSHFIYNTPLGRSGAKHSIWWADNCPGQNKNNCMFWFFSRSHSL